MISRAQIDQFFGGRTIAMVGVSRNNKKFGYVAYKTLAEKNSHSLYPVNPATDEIDGQKCFRDIASLPADVHGIVLMTRKDQTAGALRQCLDKGIKNIWLQQHTESKEALEIAATSDANIIHGKCIIMFSEPVTGMHKFHRGIKKFFGQLPQ